MNKKLIIGIIVGIVIIGGLCVLAFVILTPAVVDVYGGLLDEAGAAGENFLQALKDEDYETAYELLGTDIQNEIGGIDGLMEFFPPDTIESWNFEVSPTTTEGDAESVYGLFGEMILTDDSVYELEIVVDSIDGVNKVIGFTFEPK